MDFKMKEFGAVLESRDLAKSLAQSIIDEHWKHIDDHKLIVVRTASCGTSSDGADDVADPKVAKATAPQTKSSTGGIRVAELPRCCSHLPAASPMMLSAVVKHRNPSTNTME